MGSFLGLIPLHVTYGMLYGTLCGTLVGISSPLLIAGEIAYNIAPDDFTDLSLMCGLCVGI